MKVCSKVFKEYFPISDSSEFRIYASFHRKQFRLWECISEAVCLIFLLITNMVFRANLLSYQELVYTVSLPASLQKFCIATSNTVVARRMFLF